MGVNGVRGERGESIVGDRSYSIKGFVLFWRARVSYEERSRVIDMCKGSSGLRAHNLLARTS